MRSVPLRLSIVPAWIPALPRFARSAGMTKGEAVPPIANVGDRNRITPSFCKSPALETVEDEKCSSSSGRSMERSAMVALAADPCRNEDEDRCGAELPKLKHWKESPRFPPNPLFSLTPRIFPLPIYPPLLGRPHTRACKSASDGIPGAHRVSGGSVGVRAGGTAVVLLGDEPLSPGP